MPRHCKEAAIDDITFHQGSAYTYDDAGRLRTPIKGSEYLKIQSPAQLGGTFCFYRFENSQGVSRSATVMPKALTAIFSADAENNAVRLDFLCPAKHETASGDFLPGTRLHQGKMARKLRTALEKTGRVTTKGVRHSVPGSVL